MGDLIKIIRQTREVTREAVDKYMSTFQGNNQVFDLPIYYKIVYLLDVDCLRKNLHHCNPLFVLKHKQLSDAEKIKNLVQREGYDIVAAELSDAANVLMYQMGSLSIFDISVNPNARDEIYLHKYKEEHIIGKRLCFNNNTHIARKLRSICHNRPFGMPLSLEEARIAISLFPNLVCTNTERDTLINDTFNHVVESTMLTFYEKIDFLTEYANANYRSGYRDCTKKLFYSEYIYYMAALNKNPHIVKYMRLSSEFIPIGAPLEWYKSADIDHTSIRAMVNTGATLNDLWTADLDHFEAANIVAEYERLYKYFVMSFVRRIGCAWLQRARHRLWAVGGLYYYDNLAQLQKDMTKLANKGMMADHITFFDYP